MMDSLKAFWTKIPSEDRKLIHRTVLICLGVLAVSLVGLYFYATAEHNADSKPVVPVDSLPEPNLAPPPPPPGNSNLLGTISDGQELLDPNLISLPTDESSHELDNFDANAHRELMRLAAAQYNYTRSLAHAKRIAQLMANDPKFQAEIGHVFLESGHPLEAIPHLVLALIPRSDPEIEANLAMAMFRANAPDSALAVVKASLARHPKNAKLLTTRAAIIAEWPDTSQRQKALSYFTEVLKMHPKYADARYQFSRFLMAQGNMKSALQQSQQARELDPLNPKIIARLGMAHFYLNQDDLAEKFYRTALAINPADYNTWFNLGELYLSQANEASTASQVKVKTHAALECYLAALALAPSLHAAHFRTGMILNGNAQYREAIQHLEFALNEDPQSVRILLQLATAWEQLGDINQAISFLEIAHAADPFHKIVANQWLRLKNLSSPQQAQGSL